MIDRRGLLILAAATVPLGAGLAHAQAARLNPNTATAPQLRAVQGLTPAMVQQILAKRPFKSMSAFDAAVGAGLSAEQKQALYARLFVPIALNSASREDIMLVPGMSRRMAHEFEEYRPYKSLDQFNKEIGKYVDQAEVARLRSYVVLD